MKPLPVVSAAADEDLLPPKVESALPDEIRQHVGRPFTGDLDEMVKRRLIRIGVTYNRTLYFVDKGEQRGGAYEYGKLFEDELNKKLKTGNLKVHVFFAAVPRDQLLRALTEGKVDLVMAQVTVRPELQKLVDFTNPTRTDVNQIVVTGHGAPAIATVDDLAGQEVFVRKNSPYDESLHALNEKLKAAGKPPVSVQEVPGSLEDDDVLEMVNSGLIKITVVDSYLAEFWKQVFTNLTVLDAVALRSGGTLAVGIRKNSPKLAAELNAFIARYGLGTAFGNMMEKRYLQSTKFVKNATADAERKKLEAVVALFKKYGDQYQVDYLLMAAQGYQESTLDQNVKEPGRRDRCDAGDAVHRQGAEGGRHPAARREHPRRREVLPLDDGRVLKDEPMDSLNKGSGDNFSGGLRLLDELGIRRDILLNEARGLFHVVLHPFLLVLDDGLLDAAAAAPTSATTAARLGGLTGVDGDLLDLPIRAVIAALLLPGFLLAFHADDRRLDPLVLAEFFLAGRHGFLERGDAIRPLPTCRRLLPVHRPRTTRPAAPVRSQSGVVDMRL